MTGTNRETIGPGERHQLTEGYDLAWADFPKHLFDSFEPDLVSELLSTAIIRASANGVQDMATLANDGLRALLGTR